jgi:Ca2+-binding RTX toxin-like protein
LIGGTGDKLNGEGGNDTLMALGDSNFLIGGLGSDRFVIKDNHTTGGRNTILDFTPGVDQLVIAGTAAGSTPSVLFEATSAGVAVTIAGDSNPAAMLSGLRPSSLEAARDVAYISSSLSAPLLTAVADVQQLHQSL